MLVSLCSYLDAVLKSPHKSLLAETGAGAGVGTGAGESKSKRISEYKVRKEKEKEKHNINESLCSYNLHTAALY